MWTLDRIEIIDSNTLVFFTKGTMTRNTRLPGLATEEEIQALIDMWEAEDAAAATVEEA